ncbi:MAG: leucine-rich repeat protein [Bacteroidetes bacterium]|nr:leucine-rich repeat protein [Bacteroidota bacterium]
MENNENSQQQKNKITSVEGIELDLTNKEFNFASEFIMRTNKLVYLTGRAGTGKTTFLKYLRETTNKKMVVLAPTGVAAINARGQTIHSFFQIRPSVYVPNDKRLRKHADFDDEDRSTIYDNFQYNSNKLSIIRKLELLVIDEISMVRCDLLDVIDRLLRVFRKREHEPFGGVQVLLIGDTFQLPPVAQDEEWSILSRFYKNSFFFSAKVIKENTPIYIELKKIYRQKEQDFIDLLNRVRVSQLSQGDISKLNAKCNPDFEPKENENYIILATHNEIVRRTNRGKLQELPTELKEFEATIKDNFPEKDLPTDKILQLKENAQIMFVKNDKAKRFFNGKIAKIIKIDDDGILAELSENEQILIERETWENIRYVWNNTLQKVEEEVIGTFTQYPIKLAWAITVHKSQGLTFEKVIADLGAAFTPGQVYVALSRCTTFNGLVLRTNLHQNAIKTAPEVLEFAKNETPDTLIISELNSGKADFYYKQARENLKSSDFELAYDNLLNAFKYRNDFETDTFKRYFVDFGTRVSSWKKRCSVLKEELENQKEETQQIIEEENESIPTWKIYGNTLVISGKGTLPNYRSDCHRYDDTPWKGWRNEITSIIIENGVQGFQDNYFSNCNNLMYISIPASVIKIVSVSYPRHILMENCKNLKSISVDSNNPNYSSEDGILFDKKKTELIKYPEGKKDANYIVPNSVTLIGNGAFSNCVNLSSITLPEGVRIDNNIFSGCINLKSLFIPASIELVGNMGWTGLFHNCKNLISINVDSNNPHYRSENGVLFEICDFEEMRKTLIIYPEGKTDTIYIIPNDVTDIGEYAFFDSIRLMNIIVPQSVKNIQQDAFFSYNGLNLTTIYVENNNLYYCSENGVLFNKEKTKLLKYPEGKTDVDYIIPESVTDIEDDAFRNCRNLTSITIGSNVMSIKSPFEGCDGLKQICVKTNIPPKIDCYFDKVDTKNCILYVPFDCKDKYANTDGWRYFKNIEEEKNCDISTDYVEINGVKWATRNVDEPGTFAPTPESAGTYYRKNDRTVRDATGSVIGWDRLTANDPSPNGWRMPTGEEQETLFDKEKVINEWVTQNDVSGRKFTDKATGVSLFLPAAGSCSFCFARPWNVGITGYYCNNSLYTYNDDAYYLTFDSGEAYVDRYFRIFRSYYLSVRCVKK